MFDLNSRGNFASRSLWMSANTLAHMFIVTRREQFSLCYNIWYAPRKPKKFRSGLALRVALRVDSFFRYLSSVCTVNLAGHSNRSLLLRLHTFRRALPLGFPNSSCKRAAWWWFVKMSYELKKKNKKNR